MGRDNPYPVNEFVQAPNWDFQVMEELRGEEAWQTLFEADEFNDPPPEGMEYLMLNIYAISTYEDNEPHSIDSFDFNVIGDHHILYDTPFVWNPEPEFGAELYTGGETEGWATYLVGNGEGNLILILDEWANFEDDRYRYLALDEGASLTIPAEFAQIDPNDVGLERENPAAFGETAVTDNWEVTVLEVVRGDAAAALVEAADEFFYEPPEAGIEYVLVRVRGHSIGTEDSAEWLDSSNFGMVGDQNVVYETPWLTVPHPGFDYNIYPGADVEGWVSLQAAEGEGGLVMTFESYYDYSDGSQRFFALE
jgi:hypothetical protein